MRKRTRSREFALQILYQIDITHDDCEDSLSNFWQSQEAESADCELKDFTTALVKGVAENLKLIDTKISQYAANWKLERETFNLMIQGNLADKSIYLRKLFL